LEVIAGLGAWEFALFSVFNRLKESGGALVAASRSTPLNLPVALADLKSRLQSGLTLQVHALDDRQKREALILRARQRGMQMSDAVADYIMLRSARDLPALIDVLDRLDASTLQQQRQLTVPLVKQTLGW
jgi:DnaA family protein